MLSSTRVARLRKRSPVSSEPSRMRFVSLSADQRPFTHDDPQLGLRPWLESQGHEFVVSDDKEGAQSFLNKNITDVRKR